MQRGVYSGCGVCHSPGGTTRNCMYIYPAARTDVFIRDRSIVVSNGTRGNNNYHGMHNFAETLQVGVNIVSCK